MKIKKKNKHRFTQDPEIIDAFEVIEPVYSIASTLTFAEVSRTNAERCTEWHQDMHPWTGADWSNAMAGEAGEACNVVKKLRRLETKMRDDGTRPEEQDPMRLRDKLADEIADTFLYLDLLATHYGIDVPAAIISKFNRVSEERGFEHRL